MRANTIEWAAGLFEGEGCITTRGKGYDRLCLKMTDKDVVEKFHSTVQVGQVIFIPTKNPKWKDAWQWQCQKRSDVYFVLNKFLPYLGNRRAFKALNVLDHYELD